MKKGKFICFILSMAFATQLNAQDKKTSPQQTNMVSSENDWISKTKTNSERIYIIDGVQVSPTMINSNPLDLISPNDIESIEVIKGALILAIYGAKIKGVVFVTTKKEALQKISNMVNDKKALATLINISPNSKKDVFNVNLGILEINGAMLRVYNVEGNVVFNSKITNNQQTISLENMPKGSYLMEIIHPETGRILKKMVKE